MLATLNVKLIAPNVSLAGWARQRHRIPAQDVLRNIVRLCWSYDNEIYTVWYTWFSKACTPYAICSSELNLDAPSLHLRPCFTYKIGLGVALMAFSFMGIEWWQKAATHWQAALARLRLLRKGFLARWLVIPYDTVNDVNVCKCNVPARSMYVTHL